MENEYAVKMESVLKEFVRGLPVTINENDKVACSYCLQEGLASELHKAETHLDWCIWRKAKELVG